MRAPLPLTARAAARLLQVLRRGIYTPGEPAHAERLEDHDARLTAHLLVFAEALLREAEAEVEDGSDEAERIELLGRWLDELDHSQARRDARIRAWRYPVVLTDDERAQVEREDRENAAAAAQQDAAAAEFARRLAAYEAASEAADGRREL